MPVSFVRTEAKKNILFAQSRKRNEKRFSVKKITLGPAGQSDNSRHRQTPCSYPNRNLLLSAAAAFRPSSAARICATRTASIRLRSTLTSTPRPPTLLYPRQGPSNDTLRHAPGGGGCLPPGSPVARRLFPGSGKLFDLLSSVFGDSSATMAKASLTKEAQFRELA